MDALAFLAKPPAQFGPLYVLHGDESFLKRRIILLLREKVLGPDADAGSASTLAGDQAQFAEVFDELQTAPFFAPRRLVIIEQADRFVTEFRGLLEKHVGALPASGLLVLDVKLWAATTRLAKLVDAAATLTCKAPPAYRLPAWCADWAKRQFQKQLDMPAANLLVEAAGSEMGMLDQEIQKLALFVGDRANITVEDVDRLVGQNRSGNTWKIFDALAEGQTGQALAILGRQFEQGEEVMRLLGAFGMTLRRLAQAGRLAVQGMSIGAALAQVGVPPFAVKSAEAQLRHLGRARAARLFDWLLEINLGLRGASPLSERAQMERFLLRLAQPAAK